MSEIKLKSCPFCGGEAKIIEIGHSGSVIQARCTGCGAGSKLVALSAEYAAADKVTNNWNQRNGITQNQSKWEICSDGYYPYCLSCKKEPPGREMTRYCPNCGARMDEEAQQ